MRRPRVSLYNLGCRVNQYETRETAAELVRRGYRIVPFGHAADVCVVNTCSVTHEADAKSRAALRRAARCGGEPLVVATGCYVETAPETVAAMPEVATVAPNDSKPRLAEIVDDTLRLSGRMLFQDPLSEEDDSDPSVGPPEALGEGQGLIQLLREGEGSVGRTRAVIKIQDGCNHFCTFCIIPFTRGRLRSRTPADVLAEARELAAVGYRELVLVGICLGDYGDEKGLARGERDPLALLIERLAEIDGIDRIRLSSMDPADTSADLLATMAAVPQVCPHLHLSLQAGSEDVLRRMRRRYTAERFRELVGEIYAAMPDAGLTCDVIAGFPGESDSDFHDTLRLCEEARFLHIHAFPYSPRTGTAAARLDDDVSHAEKQARVRELSGLSERLGLRFAEERLGETVQVLIEQRDRRGLLTGLAPNYLRVTCDGPDEWRGRVVPIRIDSAGSGGAHGSPAPTEPVDLTLVGGLVR